MTFSPSNIWSDEKIERLKLLWGTDLSMAGIAAEMGVSRNSVIGKCNRLGLPSRGQAPRLTEEELRRRRLERQRVYDEKRRTFGARLSKTRKRVRMDTPSIVASTPYVGDLRIPLRDLRDFSNKRANQCRFIADEPPGPDYLACGNETQAGESYCAHCRPLTRTTHNHTRTERAQIIRLGTRQYLASLRSVA